MTARGKTTPTSTAGSFAAQPARKSRTQPDTPIKQPVPPFKIIAVADTRDFIEHDDRWVPVPGSGDTRECDRCGRLHEIHATIEDATARTYTVGVGCANADDATARRLRADATREARSSARDARQQNAEQQLVSLIDTVNALPFPADQIVHTTPASGPWTDTWEIDGLAVRGFAGSDPAERARCLESTWRKSQAEAVAGGAGDLRTLCKHAERPTPWL